MTPERWKEVRDALHRALELAPGRRSAFLDGVGAKDKSLRREVESLLAAEEDVRSSFLQSRPVLGLAGGTQLGDYTVQAPIGAGGMGEVYRARDNRLRREVAIKVLPAFVSADPERLRRFEQEAVAAAALNHPNILAVYQLGTYEGAPYLVSELLEGETLREQIKRGRIAMRKAIEYGVQIAHGLDAAHEKGIVHRDLKPENLFVTKGGRVKILDFGLAKLTQAQPASQSNAPTVGSETEPGQVMGTVGYMAPEQVRGECADYRADIFAFGAILYEMLTGTRAFQKPTSAETMTAILNEEPPLAQIIPAIPPALQRVVQRCLEKSPAQRFHSASDLAFTLESSSESTSSATNLVTTLNARASWKWLVAAMILIAFSAVTAVWLTREPATPVVEAVTQLTNDGEVKPAGLETDGSRIYLNEGISASMKIAQVSVAGGDTAQVPAPLINPQIAGLRKDGSALLVLSFQGLGLSQGMWLLPLPAGVPRRLGDMSVFDANLFPDGRLVYAQGSAIYSADKDGSNSRKLTELPDVLPDSPAVSPSGDRIVFDGIRRPSLFSGNGPALYELGLDGGGLHEIVHGGQGELPSELCCGRWSPDGKYLLFRAHSQGRWDLWILPERRTFMARHPAPVRLTNGPLSYTAAVFSRDGKGVFAIGTKERGELLRYDSKSAKWEPYLGGVSVFDPTFSRDGKWLAYLSYPDHTLWRSRSDGSDRQQLTYPPQLAIYPRISPDGTKVTYSGSDDAAYIVSMSGGAPHKLSENAASPNWSPDGNFVVFTSLVSGKSLWEKGWLESRIMDLRSGTVSVVPDSQGTIGPWFIGQDLLVAASEDAKKFRLFNVRTGKWSDFAENSDSFYAWEPSPDGKYLYCTTAGNDPKALRIRIADRGIETIASLKNFHQIDDPDTSQIGVAPDGSALITRDLGTQEVYAISVKWP
jgi:serine/threonine protein kinase/Tol biopolymer transport system component